MKLNLTKPLVVFDLETTGLDIITDRIIQLSYIKVTPDGTEVRGNHLINPERAIPAFVTDLTGISDETVADQPTFKEMAPQLAESFKGCDFAGFNSNRFDVPILAEEFLRVGVDFDFTKCRLIDAQTIFHKMERRNLAAAYKFYCGREMDEDFEAHRADQDTEVTYRVLLGELEMYSEANQDDPERVLPNDVSELAAFSRQNDNVDFAGRMIWAPIVDKDGTPLSNADGTPQLQEVFNFGKYKDMPVSEVLHKDPGYYSWMLGAEFPNNTKQVLTRIRLREFNKH
jgi:exonuclease